MCKFLLLSFGVLMLNVLLCFAFSCLALNVSSQNATDEESSPLIENDPTSFQVTTSSVEKEAVSFFGALRIPVSNDYVALNLLTDTFVL